MLAREKTHIFRLGAWWWAARLMMTIPSTFSVAFFTISMHLKPEHGGRAFYPRQVVVQGQLIFISMLFVHFMLVARDVSYDDAGRAALVGAAENEDRNHRHHQHDQRRTYHEGPSLSYPGSSAHPRAHRRNRKFCSYQVMRSSVRACVVQMWSFGIVERPLLLLHTIAIFAWRIYASFVGSGGDGISIHAGDDVDNGDAPFIRGAPVNTTNTSSASSSDVDSLMQNKSVGFAADVAQKGLLPILWIFSCAATWASFSEITKMVAKVRVGRDPLSPGYQGGFVRRWSYLLLFQFANLVASFFSPGGPPTWYPFATINACILGVLAEVFLGTIRERSFEVWSSKYHVVAASMFAIPMIILSLWEVVGMVVGNYNDYGQIHVSIVGAIGGDSNQLSGGRNSIGWWFGTHGQGLIAFHIFCYGGVGLSLLVLPYLVVCIGLRGPKAPDWLSGVLAHTNGHIPVLTGKSNNRFHFFISKHEKRKSIAIQIANRLRDAGFKVWISQFEARQGRPVDKNAMQVRAELT